MRVLILFLGSIFLLTSCLTEQKEKELPSYFCNENLEKYFARNDSLPIININPNDSFGVIKESIDSLYKVSDYPKFRIKVKTDSLHEPTYIKTGFIGYFPNGNEPMFCGSTKNILNVLLNSRGNILVGNNVGNDEINSTIITEFILNNGISPKYSDNPQIACINFRWDKGTSSKGFNQVLLNIIDGYIKALSLVSSEKYHKQLCNLNKYELDTVNSIVPFNFYIDYLETRPHYLLTQPPTIIEDEFLQDSE